MAHYRIVYRNELYHHGIHGQKWGVRNGPPYPLSESKNHKVRYGSSDSELETHEKRKKKYNARSKTAMSLAVANFALDVVMLSPYVITDGKRLVDAAIASAKANKYYKNREAANNIDSKTGLHKKTKEMSQAEDLKMVNPEFKSFSNAAHNNCMLCTTTYDLRRRGYDVTADYANFGYSSDTVKEWYPKATVKHVESTNSEGKYDQKLMIENTKKELIAQGDGARGNLMIGWKYSPSGHSVAYEVENGQLKILDGQSNKIYTNPDKILSKARLVDYARLDNVDPDYEKIKKECVR